MSKKFGKLFIFSAVAGAAAAGAYYYLQKKQDDPLHEMDDEDFEFYNADCDAINRNAREDFEFTYKKYIKVN